MYRPKKDVLKSIRTRKFSKNGIEYVLFSAFLGSDPVTHKKVRVSRSSRDELDEYIREFYRRLSIGGESAAVLSPYQANDARNAYDLMAQNGITLTLVDCVRAMIENGSRGIVESESANTTISEAISKYLESIVTRSKQYQSGNKCYLGKLSSWFGPSSMLSDVKAPLLRQFMMEEYFDKDDLKTWNTYNGVLGIFKTFFRWCVSQEQQLISKNPIDGMKRLEIEYHQPEYIKASEAEKLFRVLEKNKESCPEILANSILSFFCGMRQAEIARVREGEESVRISLEDRFIRVRKCKGSSRGIRPRAFHIPDQAYAWMTSFDFMSAIMKYIYRPRKKLDEFAKKAEITVPHNAGRHTFITMFEAVHHDSSALSAIVGNTEDVRSKSYNGVELEKEGRAYFAIMPSEPSGTRLVPSGADAAASRSAAGSPAVPSSDAS